MGDRNFGMHLKDHDNAEGRRGVRQPEGVLDLAAVLTAALREVEVQGSDLHRVRSPSERSVAGHEEVHGVYSRCGQEVVVIRIAHWAEESA